VQQGREALALSRPGGKSHSERAVAFKTKVLDLAKKQIQGWHLPDQILDEVYRFLTQILPDDIEHNLIRGKEGMIAECLRRDPHVLGREHQFVFSVYFGDDEESLFVTKGYYRVIES
jgi:hypothetical protein